MPPVARDRSHSLVPLLGPIGVDGRARRWIDRKLRRICARVFRLKRFRVRKNVGKTGDLRRVPTTDVLIKRVIFVKHFLHRRHRRRVPVSNRMIKLIRATKHSVHVRNFAMYPRSRSVDRTLSRDKTFHPSWLLWTCPNFQYFG